MKRTIFILTLTIVAMVVGCNTEKRATRLISKGDRINETVLPKVCASRWKGTDSVHEKTVYKPGETIIDTVTKADTLLVNDTLFITKEKKIYQTRVDTQVHTEYKQIVNNAAIDSMAIYVRKVEGNNIKLTQQRNTWRSVGIAALIAIVLYFIVVFIIRKFKR